MDPLRPAELAQRMQTSSRCGIPPDPLKAAEAGRRPQLAERRRDPLNASSGPYRQPPFPRLIPDVLRRQLPGLRLDVDRGVGVIAQPLKRPVDCAIVALDGAPHSSLSEGLTGILRQE